jgi:hypothetical protein
MKHEDTFKHQPFSSPLAGMSATHEPTVNTAACSAGIGKLDVTFHGGASWLYNLFSGVIAGARTCVCVCVCVCVIDEWID